ncbi:chromate efflux transporter [Geodermatophilus marinus]|uniref:chromate efflux transporter n=1 Tax=Geodermatophilus sp. LHW52908 TaxID=2303986 RepID=UPI000E3E9172|nr:chromate efflux transporter [Geodermatophilus sp. LHW52908]RFU20810.1 chromate efflux transporter [Geodermatophilus sp. LHW52908]
MNGTSAGGARGQEHPAVPFRTAVRVWFLVSLQTFGGPAGQIAVLQRTLVDERRWIGQRRFLHALNYCMLLPGPEAQQLATYTGWLLHGTRGGLVAGGLFVLPGALALLALSALYVAAGSTLAVTALFAGLSAAVLAVVAQAVGRVARRALRTRALAAIAVAAFLALSLFAVPFPAVVAAAAAAGWVLARRRPSTPPAESGQEADPGPRSVVPDDVLHGERPSARRTLRVLLVGSVVWGAPVAAVALLSGPSSTLTELGVFFSGAAVVTFGGAYAVLSYVAQQAVQVYGWLGPREMARGLALAETTPGPLIMVVQFVAFLGAHRAAGGLDPWVAAVLASLLVTWVTFVPSFLFVLLGAPYMERLRGNRSLAAALSGITAAVVGVIASLGVYLAVHTLFGRTHRLDWGVVSLEVPEPGTVRWVAVAIAAIAVALLFAARWSVLRTLGVCAVLGLAAGLVGLPVA